MSNLYVGIDNGISGGIAVLSDQSGVPPIAMRPMPIEKARKGNQVNIKELYCWLTEVTGGNLSNATYIIEEPGGSKSAKAATSMAGSFHAIRGFLDTKMLRWMAVTPQKWQKEMIPGKAEDTKARALTMARQLWPEETWLATPKCRVPNDGLVDACLISEWARRHDL